MIFVAHDLDLRGRWLEEVGRLIADPYLRVECAARGEFARWLGARAYDLADNERLRQQGSLGR